MLTVKIPFVIISTLQDVLTLQKLYCFAWFDFYILKWKWGSQKKFPNCFKSTKEVSSMWVFGGLTKENVISSRHIMRRFVLLSPHAFTPNAACVHWVCAVSFQTVVLLVRLFFRVSIPVEHLFLQVSVFHLTLPDYISTLCQLLLSLRWQNFVVAFWLQTNNGRSFKYVHNESRRHNLLFTY